MGHYMHIDAGPLCLIKFVHEPAHSAIRIGLIDVEEEVSGLAVARIHGDQLESVCYHNTVRTSAGITAYQTLQNAMCRAYYIVSFRAFSGSHWASALEIAL